MLSIRENNKYEEIVKNSKFISLLFRVQNIDEVNYYFEKVKEEYKDATHYCYGYVIDNIIKFSDDREPSKTAGPPILSQITGNNLNYTLIIVVRYFGGIKLGTGLLTRTYSKVAREVIKKENIISLIKGWDITIIFNYPDLSDIDYILKNSEITKKNFDEKITYHAKVSSNTLNKLSKYDTKINKEIYIEEIEKDQS